MPRKIDCRSQGTRKETPIIFVMGDGRSEKTYFEHLNRLVKGTRLEVYDLGKSGWRIILKDCDGRVRSDGINPRHDRVAIVTDEDGRYDRESIRIFQKDEQNRIFYCPGNLWNGKRLNYHFMVGLRSDEGLSR